MYASDYYYSALPKHWSKSSWYEGDDKDNYRSAINDNWLFLYACQWTISRISTSTTPTWTSGLGIGAFIANEVGNLQFSQIHNVSQVATVRPTFYLKSEVKYAGGIGTSSNPIRISM